MEEDYKLTLFDRIEVIKTVNKQYDLENNSYISFSGGKDSIILSNIIDIALPGNNIPRVYANPGIEFISMYKFVLELSKLDKRIIILNPTKPIKKTLEEYGYPFKSKQHSHNLAIYQNQKSIIDCDNIERVREQGEKEIKIIEQPQSEPILKEVINYHIPFTLVRYLGIEDTSTKFRCPKSLLFQFKQNYKLKCSDNCCLKMKKEPLHKWAKLNNKSITILGLRTDEGGQRASHSGCVVLDGNALSKFKPLNPISDEFESWFIKVYHIKLCELYYPPYNFKRTGCKGCPFNIELQHELDILSKYFINEYKQCEIIWKPVYSEYRRLGYRLKNNSQLSLF